MSIPGKARLFWPLLVTLLGTDCATKELAETRLAPAVPEQVMGDYVRLTLAYNRGAALSISVGGHSRLVFSLAAVVAIVLLARFYRRIPAPSPGLVAAIALMIGGALGNLLDRLRSPRGVVDFIDLGIGSYRFWTFNVADVGVSIGAVMLAWFLARSDRAEERSAP
jgi:signal peptidase II